MSGGKRKELRRRSALCVLLAVVASLVAFADAPAAQAETRGSGSEPVVVSPRPGQVVRDDDVSVRLRVRGALRQARLNGTPLAGELGTSRHGVRSVEASVSQGLRAGSNVIQVATSRPGGGLRRAIVHFTVRPGGLMVGAGRDREAGIDGVVDLRGQVRGDEEPGASADAHWTLVGAPRAEHPGQHLAPPAITSPDGPTAEFDPSAPGEYVFAFEDGKRRDFVRLEARPRNLLVPIDTMAGGRAGEPGIQIGFQPSDRFDLKDAEHPGGNPPDTLQVLVLERATLGFVRNVVFAKVDELERYLAGLTQANLVIVVSQPRATAQPNFTPAERDALGRALSSIGGPEYGSELPLRRGGLSVIGVPGLPKGSADVNVLPEESDADASMQGYLSPDQHGNFGFVPKLQIPFSMPESPSPACAQTSCPDKAGFRLRALDGRTGKVVTQAFFPTGVAGSEGLAELSEAISDVASEDVVELEARSVERPKAESEPAFQQVVANPSIGLINFLAKQIAALGGTRDAFLQMLSQDGSTPWTTMPYALVGWRGAEEGNGIEVSQSNADQKAKLRLSGVLRPDQESRLRPALVTAAPIGHDLAQAAMSPPHDRWPLEGTPAGTALSYLGETVGELGPDPRSEYWRQDELSPSDWRAIATKIEKEDYRDVPRGRRGEFDGEDFDEAQDQLVKELLWVAKVTSYTERLADPFDKSVFKSWREVQEVGAQVANELQVSPADQSAVAVRYSQLVSNILKVGGGLTAGVSASLGAAIDVGIWAFGAQPDGRPTYQMVNTKTVAVGVKFSEEMEAAAANLSSMRNVVVSDPDKLEYVGENAFCSAASPKCLPAFAYTSVDAKRVSVDISRGLQKSAYELLLPLKFRPVRLRSTTEGGYLAPPDALRYVCPLEDPEKPFAEWNATQVKYATGGLLESFQVAGVESNTDEEPWYRSSQSWEPFALIEYPVGRYAVAPSAELLNRMFGRVPSPSDQKNYDNPNAGGLEISLAAMARSGEPLKYWRDKSGYLPFPTRCEWR
jgi:hypothetical protein